MMNGKRPIFRAGVLLFFMIALLGPWMYDVIHVPVEYTCDKPIVRLEGDFCGLPLSGFQFFKWFTGGLLYSIVDLVKGTFTGRFRELLAGLSCLPLIPFVTTLLLFWKRNTSRLRVINLIAWILAFILTLTIFILQKNEQGFQLWGLWFDILLAVSAIVIEFLAAKNNPAGNV